MELVRASRCWCRHNRTEKPSSTSGFVGTLPSAGRSLWGSGFLPPSLQGEVSWTTNHTWLIAIPFLKSAEPQFMIELSLQLHADNNHMHNKFPAEDSAAALRERFVFKLIPMLNPDGVFLGHTRADTRGVNLNRAYVGVNVATFPAQFGVLELVKAHHAKRELLAYLDLHAHAGKRGCFFCASPLRA